MLFVIAKEAFPGDVLEYVVHIPSAILEVGC